MGAGGDFGNDTTIFGKDVDLGNYDVAQNTNAVFDNGGSGFITAGFDSQNFHCLNYSTKTSADFCAVVYNRGIKVE